MTDQLSIFAWNAHTGTSAAAIADRLTDELRSKRGRFDYAGLFEVGGRQHGLARWAVDHGYRIIQEDARPNQGGRVSEHGSTALLVDRRRDDFDHLGDRFVPMMTPWTVFSHQREHDPRRFVRSRDETAGGKWKVQASHFPTNGFRGGNRAAFLEAAARSAAFLRSGTGRVGHVHVDVLPKGPSDHHALRYTLTRRTGGTIPVVFGDLNEKVEELEAWASRVGAHAVGHNVDVLVSR
jgi:hypothetical protein